MARYAAFVATKRGMGEVLRLLIGAGSVTSTGTRARLAEAVTPILEVGRSVGVLRNDVLADDLVAAMAGAMMAAAGPDPEAQTTRLLDLVVPGLRA